MMAMLRLAEETDIFLGGMREIGKGQVSNQAGLSTSVTGLMHHLNCVKRAYTIR